MLQLMRRATFIGAAGVLAIACSGGAAPTLPPGASIPPINVPSFSIVPDQPLEDMFPDDIAGHAITVESAQGASVLTLFNSTEPTEFNEFLSNIGATIDQVSAGFSFNLWPGATADDFTGLTMIALRVRDVPAATTMQRLVTLVQEDVSENAEVAQATIAGKAVTAVTDPDSDDPQRNLYLYPVGDVVFMVGGTPPEVEEAFSKLP